MVRLEAKTDWSGMMTEPIFEDLYTPTYVQRQLEKFRNRHDNHWKAHLDLAASLVERFAPPPPARPRPCPAWMGLRSV